MKKCLVVLGCAVLWNGPGSDLARAQTATTPLENRVPAEQFAPAREMPDGAFPTPPQQNAPWQDERHDAFSRVVERLFAAGMADPRGCEYCDVVFVAGPTRFVRADANLAFDRVSNGASKRDSDRAFVLPLPDGALPDAPRYAVAWNGQLYRVASVGAPQDWRADLAQMAKNPRRGGSGPFEITQQAETDFSTPRVLKAVIAERLGAPRQLFSEIQLAGAAQSYLHTLSLRAGNAHLRGDDVAALAFLQQEAAANSALSDALDARSLQNRGRLMADAALLLDQKRRALEAKIPVDAGETPAARWIRELQNLRAHQMSMPGSVHFDGDASFQGLVELGAAAVPALIEAVEDDRRLTRSAQSSGGFSFDSQGEILPVSLVAFDALMKIWGVGWDAQEQLFGGRTQVFEPAKRAELVAQLRRYNQKYPGLTGLQRQFAVLRDDLATPTQWLDVMRAFNAPTRTAYQGLVFYAKFDPKTKKYVADQDLTPHGTPLKNQTAPSVSDVVEKRVNEVARRAFATPIREVQARHEVLNLMQMANDLALEAAKWDLPRALPLLQAQAARTPALAALVAAGAPAPDAGFLSIATDAQQMAARSELSIFAARRRAPQLAERHAAAQDYANWLQKQSFGSLENDFYAPIWRCPDEPSLQRAAQTLFGAPQQPFGELLLRAGQKDSNGYNEARGFGLIDTPLLTNDAFRGAVRRELSNLTPAGTLHFPSEGQFWVEFRSGDRTEGQISRSAHGEAAPDASSLRVADVVAARFLGQVGPPSRTRMLEFWWPQPRRDAAIARLKIRLQNGHDSFDPHPMPFDF